MWYKNTPLEKFFFGFKAATVPFSLFYSLAMVAAGIAFLQSGIGIILFVQAGFTYWCGRSIHFSLLREAQRRRMENFNEGSEEPPGTV